MDYEEVLKHLCALPGPSGFESPVAQAAASRADLSLPASHLSLTMPVIFPRYTGAVYRASR